MSIVLKTLAELEPRELFLIEDRFAIYVRAFEGGGHGVVYLDDLRFVVRHDGGEHIVSYGLDWTLDVGDVEFTDEAPAGFYIGTAGPVIAALGEKALLWLDAATLTPASRPAAWARVTDWAIWRSPADRESIRGVPVVAALDGDE